ncbi:MAG: AsmA family protein [Smithellaceae bacterium]
MLNKILIAVGVVITIIVIMLIVAGVIVYKTVDKDFIATKLGEALNRQVYIEKIDVSIFSVISGIEVGHLAMSNFKSPGQLESLHGKPVDAADVFVSVESLRFKVKFLPLLRRQVEIKELVLHGPVVNLSKNKQGVLNIDDLIKSKKPAADENKAPQTREPAKPVSADDLPLAVAVGEVGLKNATINYHDAQYDQTLQVYNLTAMVHDIQIDPKDLEKKNEIKMSVKTGIKTVGSLTTGSVQNFDVTIEALGKVIPFDISTRLLEPEASLHVSIPDGEITGLQIFNAVGSIPVLGDYLGEYISFLKGTQKWQGSKNSELFLLYKADQAEIKGGRLDLEQARVLFDGGLNLASKALDMNLGLVMKKDINDAVLASLAEKINAAIKSPDVKKYVSAETLAQTAMKPLLNDKGRIDLGLNVKGTTAKPVVTLSRPQLGSIGVLVKDAAAGVAVEAGKEVLKEAAKQYLKEDQQKILEDVGGLLRGK